MKAFLVDVSICNGCYNCQIACKDEHCNNDWMPYAKPQPEIGQFWLKLEEHIRGTVPKVKMHYVSVICQHCANAACLAACPVKGAIYTREDGLVIIDPVKCNGCKKCVSACPYEVIYFNKEMKLAQKCTGCAHLLDKGWKEPRCVDACPTGALQFGEESELKDKIAKASDLKPGNKDQVRVHYLNIPKQFVAGTVYDPVKKEIIKGAVCTLTGKDGKKVVKETNGFGDFWFEGLGESLYSLEITAQGYKHKIIKEITTKESVNLGDIPLS